MCGRLRRAPGPRPRTGLLVILSGGREAPEVEGPHWSRAPAAAAAYPVWDAFAVRLGGRRRAGTPLRLRRRFRAWVAARGKAAVKGRWAGTPIGPASPVILSAGGWLFVILSAGGEAAGVEGSHWSRAPAAAAAYPVWDAFAVRPGGRRRAGTPLRLRRRFRAGVADRGKAAVKGRWACLPIGSAVHGSRTSTFALRNLHKSPGRRVEASPRLLLACGLRPRQPHGDWCRFRAAGLGSGARPTRRRPRARARLAAGELAVQIFGTFARRRHPGAASVHLFASFVRPWHGVLSSRVRFLRSPPAARVGTSGRGYALTCGNAESTPMERTRAPSPGCIRGGPDCGGPLPQTCKSPEKMHRAPL